MIIGRDPPGDIAALNGSSGIEVTGSVPDVKPYLAEAAALVVPLDAGGGTRLKILEAFAAGLPVVSTAVGIEGIAAAGGVHFLQAERPNIAQAILDLVNNPERGKQLAEKARALSQAMYDWRQIGATAVDAISSAVGRTG
jgi:glycosyltransferase involved in cell wall biosynthesis